MSTKVELDGGWALLRDPKEVTERGRREVRRIMFKLAEVPGIDAVFGMANQGSETPDANTIAANVEANEDAIRAHLGDGMDLIDAMQDATIIARVKEWSYLDEDNAPLPIAADSLLDLPGGAYDELKELCKDLALGLNMEPSPDPKAPTPSTTD